MVNLTYQSFSVDKVNQNKIILLNRYIRMIKVNNIIPIIVFESSSINRHDKYTKKDFNQIIDADVLHLSNFNIGNNKLWVDPAHFNMRGRERYTKKLLEDFNFRSKALEHNTPHFLNHQNNNPL